MTNYRYSCDAGSLLLGNETFTVRLGNGYGDGNFNVHIHEERCDVEDLIDYTFRTDVRGTFNVYDYDCYKDDELTDERNILTTLNGWYGIFYNNGNMMLERWGK